MKNLVYILGLLLMFTACTDEIELELNSADPQMVVEAEITNQPGPYLVKLTKTVNFSDESIYPSVQGALVIITSNNGLTDTLTETQPGIYTTSGWQGQMGVTYNLTITASGQNYTATSTMPNLVNLDSLRVNESTFAPPGGGSTNYIVVPKYTDPVGQGNNYRFFQYVNNEKSTDIIVFNDNVNDGLVNTRPMISQSLEIAVGDSLTVEMQCIDRPTYDYFFSLASVAGNGPGGGTTPANPVSNIVGNNALGYFAAYTTQKLTTVVQQ